MLNKLTKITNKKKFFKNLQINVNLNKFEFNEFNMKLSGITLFIFCLKIIILFNLHYNMTNQCKYKFEKYK